MRANGADFLTLRGGNLGIEFEASNGAAVADLSSSQFSLKTGVNMLTISLQTAVCHRRQLPGGHGGAPAARQSIPEPHLARITQDIEKHLPSVLAQGVPTGVFEPIVSSNQWPAVDAQQAQHPLDTCLKEFDTN